MVKFLVTLCIRQATLLIEASNERKAFPWISRGRWSANGAPRAREEGRRPVTVGDTSTRVSKPRLQSARHHAGGGSAAELWKGRSTAGQKGNNMVNNNSSKKAPIAPAIAVSSSASAGVSSSGNSAGSSSNPVSTTGSGSVNLIAPSSGQVPPATTVPGSGFRKEITSVVAGIGTQLLDDTTLVVNGQTVTKASLLTSFGNVLSLFATVDTVAQQLKSQRLALKAVLPAAHQLLAGLKAVLVGIFGKGNPALEAFGFSGIAPRQLTPEQKVARTVKAAATRKQRGTSGKRQKAQNKFTGTVVVQTTLSGTPAASGNAPATSSSTAGASTTPAVSGTPAPAPGSSGSSTP